MLDAQIRFAAHITREKKKDKKTRPPPMKRQYDGLHLSSEMTSWIQKTFQERDEEGYLPEAVGSILSGPMDSESLYVPTSAIVKSKYTSARGPSNPGTFGTLTDDAFGSFANETTTNFESRVDDEDNNDGEEIMRAEATSTSKGSSPQGKKTSSSSSSSSSSSFGSRIMNALKPSKPASINDAVVRLKVMWLQRRATFEKEEGKHEEALKTLDEAINLHLGTSDYLSAKLGDHTMSSDPVDLLQQIEENYFIYDKDAHISAARIQRFFLKRHRRRIRAQTRLASFFRGFSFRKRKWHRHFIRTQCALIIQRRFRIHLIFMHRQATRIKDWYVTRVARSEYYRRLAEYRRVRKIQALWRGTQGRKLAEKERYGLRMTCMVQRNTKRYRIRRDRTVPLILYHKVYYEAAIVIQCLARRFLAVRKAQMKILSELAREEDRMEQEEDLVKETVKVEIERSRLYMKTEAGRYHLSIIRRRIQKLEDRFKRNKPNLSKKEIDAHEAAVSFELFDSDGSGEIDEDELMEMLRELCIPMDKKGVHLLKLDIKNGLDEDITFDEFVKWYCDGGSEEDGDATMTDVMFKQILRARHLVMELSGQILLKRGERELLREATSWKTKDIVSTFRLSKPPKFQCCQCLTSFVLFTDYYTHFDNAGICQETGQKGLFYPRFWSQRDWKKQRQIEHEIMRYNDEAPAVAFKSSLAWYAELVSQRDYGVKQLLHKHTLAAQTIFMTKVNPVLAATALGGKGSKTLKNASSDVKTTVKQSAPMPVDEDVHRYDKDKDKKPPAVVNNNTSVGGEGVKGGELHRALNKNHPQYQ